MRDARAGVPPVAAPLADPNNASPVRWHVDDVDAALRHVAHALLTSPDTITIDLDDESTEAPGPTSTALDYLRRRIGVPRDLDYQAARQLRAHLTWAMDQL